MENGERGQHMICKPLLIGQDRWATAPSPSYTRRTYATLLGFTPDGKYLLVRRSPLPVPGPQDQADPAVHVLAVFDATTGQSGGDEFPSAASAPIYRDPNRSLSGYLVEPTQEEGGTQFLIVRGCRSKHLAADLRERQGEAIREHYALAQRAERQGNGFAARLHLRHLLRLDPRHADSIAKRLAQIDAKEK